MSDAPDIYDLARQLAVLEERMNTHQATYEGALDRFRADMVRRDGKHETALDRFRADMARRDGKHETALDRFRADMARRDGKHETALDRLRADMARRDAEVARRETRIILTIVGTIALATAVIGALLAFLALMLGNVTASPGMTQTSAVPEIRMTEPARNAPLPVRQPDSDPAAR